VRNKLIHSSHKLKHHVRVRARLVAWWRNSHDAGLTITRSRGRGFNSRSGRYQVITTWMGDRLWTGEPVRYITNHQGQLSLPSLRGR